MRWLRTSQRTLERKQGGTRSRLPPFPSFFVSPEAHIAHDTATTPGEPERQTLVVRLGNEASTIVEVIIFCNLALRASCLHVSGAW